MAIDKKYFNTFVILFAVMGALILVVANLWFSNSQQEEFRTSILQNDTLATRSVSSRITGDQIRLTDDSCATVILFWNGWVETSLTVGKKVQKIVNEYTGCMRLLVAPMHTPLDSAKNHWDSSQSSIHIVDGNQLFKDLHIPGVPATVWIDNKGNVVYTQIGYLDESALLKKLNRSPS